MTSLFKMITTNKKTIIGFPLCILQRASDGKELSYPINFGRIFEYIEAHPGCTDAEIAAGLKMLKPRSCYSRAAIHEHSYSLSGIGAITRSEDKPYRFTSVPA